MAGGQAGGGVAVECLWKLHHLRVNKSAAEQETVINLRDVIDATEASELKPATPVKTILVDNLTAQSASTSKHRRYKHWRIHPITESSALN